VVEAAIPTEAQLTPSFCVKYTNELLIGDRITTDFLGVLGINIVCLATVWGRFNTLDTRLYIGPSVDLSPPGCHYNWGELASLKASLTF